MELVLILCTLAMPTECREQNLYFDEPVTACTSGGAQAMIADWMKVRPHLRLAKYRCGPDRRSSRDA